MEVLDNPLDVFNALVLCQEEPDTLDAVLDPDDAAAHIDLYELCGLEGFLPLAFVVMLPLDFVLKFLQELELLEVLASVAPVESMLLVEGFSSHL